MKHHFTLIQHALDQFTELSFINQHPIPVPTRAFLQGSRPPPAPHRASQSQEGTGSR